MEFRDGKSRVTNSSREIPRVDLQLETREKIQRVDLEIETRKQTREQTREEFRDGTR